MHFVSSIGEIIVDITKKTQKITAVNKKTGEVKKVNLLCVGSRQFNCSDDEWGKWYKYSKQGDWEIHIDLE